MLQQASVGGLNLDVLAKWNFLVLELSHDFFVFYVFSRCVKYGANNQELSMVKIS